MALPTSVTDTIENVIDISDFHTGAYVVAVSGGVDSMVLLHMLAEQAQQQSRGDRLHRFIVAHLDHGIRGDSHQDAAVVKELANRYHIPVVFHKVELGQHASEDQARRARYQFLRAVKQASNALAIMTAHHRDDELETALLHLRRGTGRKGLTSLRSGGQNDIIRPLLPFSKQDILGYAKKHNVPWREDNTNQDARYMRNHIRHNILKGSSEQVREQIHQHIGVVHEVNQQIDALLINALHVQLSPRHLQLSMVRKYPHPVRCELMAAWLRHNELRDFSRQTIERLVRACCTARSQTEHEVMKQYYIKILPEVVILQKR